jgi:hypothetical protein
VIAPPRRSVTRFFIPLIDVLILLLTIFLLMPFVSAPPGPEPDPAAKAQPAPELPSDVKELQKRLAAAIAERDEARQRLARYQKERADRLSVRVLEIDPRDGSLHYYDPDRQELKSEADALRLITRQKYLAGNKDVFFLILYPRELTGFPTAPQIATYRQWFRDVPHGFDNPRSGA